MNMDLFGACCDLQKDAEISLCGQYRYSLRRVWSPDVMRALFIMLNPSTADAEVDDPTVRRCIGFARRWGLGGIEVRNLFAYRSAEPSALFDVHDPVGPGNTSFPTDGVRLIVAAWGAAGSHPVVRARARDVLRMLSGRDCGVFCLGLTRAGHPKHPLYVRGDTMQQVFDAAAYIAFGAHPE